MDSIRKIGTFMFEFIAEIEDFLMTFIIFVVAILSFGCIIIGSKKTSKDDPVYNCDVYKDKGCSHVDGIKCVMETCSILKEYREKNR